MPRRWSVRLFELLDGFSRDHHGRLRTDRLWLEAGVGEDNLGSFLLIVHAGKIVLGCTTGDPLRRYSSSLLLEDSTPLPDPGFTSSLAPGPGNTIFALAQENENDSIPSRVYQINVDTLSSIWSWEIPLVAGEVGEGRGLRSCRWDGDAQRLYVVGDRISRWSDDAS